jgi:hypothetical protein
MNTVPLEQLSFEVFARLLRTHFRVWTDPEHALELELFEITPRCIAAAGGMNNPKYENFALIFRGPADRLLAQRIYLFESAQLGRFELFIVPVGQDANGAQYQATFNRLVK